MVFCYTSVATIGTSYIMIQATNQGKELVQDFPDDADYFDVDSDGASMLPVANFFIAYYNFVSNG